MKIYLNLIALERPCGDEKNVLSFQLNNASRMLATLQDEVTLTLNFDR